MINCGKIFFFYEYSRKEVRESALIIINEKEFFLHSLISHEKPKEGSATVNLHSVMLQLWDPLVRRGSDWFLHVAYAPASAS